ncbi:peptide deformylase [Myxococcota bacterium]|nr:peptide deformylase [Myxococcota bacterium]
MAVRKILIWPDTILATRATPVKEVNDEVRTLVEDLFETMYAATGVGLAANQMGVEKRVVVVDLDPKGEAEDDPDITEELEEWGFTGPQEYINPEIILAEGEIVWEEGCLSVPGITGDVKRREHIIVRALDRDGETFETEAFGLFAVALQHEIDHLDGHVFVEYLSKLKRDVIKRKMQRLKDDDIDDGVAASAIV